MLKFSRGNAKLDALETLTGKQVWTFSLLSGWSCPFATECLSKVRIQPNGKAKVVDGPLTKFRCFSASQEGLFPAVYAARKHNFDCVKQAGSSVSMALRILADIPAKAGIVRIHVGGDFFNQDYFDAWLRVSRCRQDIVFYAYTKSLTYWLKRRALVAKQPNFVLTASYGGRLDGLIESERLRYAKVVYSEAEAFQAKLEIDHDDSHAALPQLKDQSFALLIHGVQPAGSEAGKAVQTLNGLGSYNRAK